jgi:hypothetical protein
VCDEGESKQPVWHPFRFCFHAGYIIRGLESLYNRADIVTEIKSGRTEWLGHVLRMESNRVHKKSWMADMRGTEALGERD